MCIKETQIEVDIFLVLASYGLQIVLFDKKCFLKIKY